MANPRTRDSGEFQVLTREDVDDPALLPRRFDLLAGEVRSLATVIERKMVPALERIVERLDTLTRDDADIRRQMNALADRIDKLAVAAP